MGNEREGNVSDLVAKLQKARLRMEGLETRETGAAAVQGMSCNVADHTDALHEEATRAQALDATRQVVASSANMVINMLRPIIEAASMEDHLRKAHQLYDTCVKTGASDPRSATMLCPGALIASLMNKEIGVLENFIQFAPYFVSAAEECVKEMKGMQTWITDQGKEALEQYEKDCAAKVEADKAAEAAPVPAPVKTEECAAPVDDAA